MVCLARMPQRLPTLPELPDPGWLETVLVVAGIWAGVVLTFALVGFSLRIGWELAGWLF